MPTLLPLLGALGAPAWADPPAEAQVPAPDVQPAPPPPEGGLTALGLVQARVTRSSVVTTNPFLDGQVVGALGGTNGTTTSLEDRSMLAEQRAVGFLTWAPRVLDGRAGLTAGFEVDYAWGDQSYQVAGNKGGGFGGDQVNLQTRRLYASFRPRLGPDHELTVLAGLQFLSDGALDPHRSGADALFRHGGGLVIWGSEAAGLAAYGRVRTAAGDLLRYRLGGFTLLENGTAVQDDVQLWVADAELHPAFQLELGAHAWWLKDNSGGSGGTFGVGPTSQLSDLQGGPRLAVPDAEGLQAETDADLLWLALDGGWNRDLTGGPVGVRGLALLNLGRLYVTDQDDVDVRGWLLGGEVRGRYAAGAGSLARLELLATSPDRELPEGEARTRYTGILTGNSYGAVGAVWATHGSLLLFSDPRAVNRQVAVVGDVSNRGDGLLAASAGLGYDLVPDRLTAGADLAHARTPAGEALGTEVHGALTAHPWPLLDLSLEGAVVTGARVEDPGTGDLVELPANPWALLVHLQWVLF